MLLVMKIMMATKSDILNLHFREGHMGVLSLLLAHGADPTLQDHHGRDPYRVALRNNNAAVAGDHGEDDDDDDDYDGVDNEY